MRTNLDEFKAYIVELQQQICNALLATDPDASIKPDKWQRNDNIYGQTNIITNGLTFEKAAVNFTFFRGNNLPQSATATKKHLSSQDFFATGISLIIHPYNPYIPCTHANLRLFILPESNTYWFGGGYDLTPYYPFIEDCTHWHKTAYLACQPFGEDLYYTFKNACDEYFYLPHRQESRGIGGIFFDNFNLQNFNLSFDFIKSIGNSFLPAYIPIVTKRQQLKFTEHQRNFLAYRRGRYVEFNLLYDRGTRFGIESNGRTESILASMPPIATWQYQPSIAIDSKEAELSSFLQPRDWLNLTHLEKMSPFV